MKGKFVVVCVVFLLVVVALSVWVDVPMAMGLAYSM